MDEGWIVLEARFRLEKGEQDGFHPLGQTEGLYERAALLSVLIPAFVGQPGRRFPAVTRLFMSFQTALFPVFSYSAWSVPCWFPPGSRPEALYYIYSFLSGTKGTEYI